MGRSGRTPLCCPRVLAVEAFFGKEMPRRCLLARLVVVLPRRCHSARLAAVLPRRCHTARRAACGGVVLYAARRPGRGKSVITVGIQQRRTRLNG